MIYKIMAKALCVLLLSKQNLIVFLLSSVKFRLLPLRGFILSVLMPQIENQHSEKPDHQTHLFSRAREQKVIPPLQTGTVKHLPDRLQDETDTDTRKKYDRYQISYLFFHFLRNTTAKRQNAQQDKHSRK